MLQLWRNQRLQLRLGLPAGTRRVCGAAESALTIICPLGRLKANLIRLSPAVSEVGAESSSGTTRLPTGELYSSGTSCRRLLPIRAGLSNHFSR